MPPGEPKQLLWGHLGPEMPVEERQSCRRAWSVSWSGRTKWGLYPLLARDVNLVRHKQHLKKVPGGGVEFDGLSHSLGPQYPG